MKAPPPGMTVANLTERILCSPLFTAEEALAIADRWYREAGETADVTRFARWLVLRGFLAESQVEQLLFGPGDDSAPTAEAAPPSAPAEPAPAEPAPAAIMRAPPTDPQITVELVATADPDLAVPPAAGPPTAPHEPPPHSTNVWLYLFLGGVGLLAVQLAGWVLAHLLALFL